MNVMRSFDDMGSGTLVDVLATSDSANGAFAMCAFNVPPEGGSPPHRRPREDEIFMGLGGEVETYDGIGWKPMPHGRSMASLSGRALRNSGQASGTMLSITTGSDHDHFLEEASSLRSPRDRAALDDISRPCGTTSFADVGTNGEAAKFLGVDPAPVNSFHVFGDLIEIFIPRRQTEGECTVFTHSAPPQGDPPANRHSEEDEIFAVVDGEFDMLSHGVWSNLNKGDVAHLLRGGVHAFRNCGQSDGKSQGVAVPGSDSADGVDQFLEGISALNLPADRGRLADVAARYAMEVLPSSDDGRPRDQSMLAQAHGAH